MVFGNCSEVGDRAVREIFELSKGYSIIIILITLKQFLSSLFYHISQILSPFVQLNLLLLLAALGPESLDLCLV